MQLQVKDTDLNNRGAPIRAILRRALANSLVNFEGKLTREKWMKLTRASSRTARRDIDKLTELGILEQEQARGPGTSYRLKNTLR